MFGSDAPSRLHINVQEDIHNVIPLNFPQHLYAAHIYHNYEHLAYTIYTHKAMMNINPKSCRPPKFTNYSHMVATKLPNP